MPWKNIYHSALGSIILEEEKSVLNEYIEKIFGYHVLQLGGYEGWDFIKNSPIKHRIYFNFENDSNFDNSIIEGDFAELPFLENSIDLVLIPHSFAFIDKQQEVLSEIHRVLLGEGQLIIIGFNPFSLFGIANKFKLINVAERHAKLVSIRRLVNWLHNFGFELVVSKTFFFRPPIKNAAILKKMVFMEIAGQMLLPKLGAIYILIAKKKVISLTTVSNYVLEKRKAVVINSMQ
jgi:SAM-dependent methyltransferase